MWVTVSMSCASQSRSRILHLCNQLAGTQKGEMSIAPYFSTMRDYPDEMAADGKALEDDDVVSHILNGLDTEYNLLIEHVNGMTDTTSLDVLYSRLLDTEAHLALQNP
jgi:hypothetical protein